MNVIRILLADDHTIVRKGLAALLREEETFRVVAEAGDGHAAVEKSLEVKPDVVLLDIGIPGLNGLEAAKQIKAGLPGVRILMLTMHETEEYIIRALKIGVCGYLIKKSAPDDLTCAIHAAMAGEIYLSPSISTRVISKLVETADSPGPGDRLDSLTAREREVLQLIAEGLSNREIAEKLFISPKTVKVHRFKMMEKLDLHNTAEITRYAVCNGLIHLDILPPYP